MCAIFFVYCLPPFLISARCLSPDRHIRYFRASKSGDWRMLWSSETSIHVLFLGSKFFNMFVGWGMVASFETGPWIRTRQTKDEGSWLPSLPLITGPGPRVAPQKKKKWGRVWEKGGEDLMSYPRECSWPSCVVYHYNGALWATLIYIPVQNDYAINFSFWNRTYVFQRDILNYKLCFNWISVGYFFSCSQRLAINLHQIISIFFKQ